MGGFKSRVKIRSAWTTYTHITGAGDLGGDGFGDLLARRSDGTLFRYDGTGAGQFKERVTVFTSWGQHVQRGGGCRRSIHRRVVSASALSLNATFG